MRFNRKALTLTSKLLSLRESRRGTSRLRGFEALRLSLFYWSCFELIAEGMRRIKGKNWKDSFFKQVEISRLDGKRGKATDETFGLLWG